MPCKKSWALVAGDVWTVRAADDDASMFMTGHLSILNWGKTSITTRVYTEAELNAGIDVPIRSGNTYLMTIISVPKGNGSVEVTGEFEVDGKALKGIVCTVTKDDPLCLWRMRRL